MDPQGYAQVSNLMIAAATVVYALALLTNVGASALRRTVDRGVTSRVDGRVDGRSSGAERRPTAQVREPALAAAGGGAAPADSAAASDPASAPPESEPVAPAAATDPDGRRGYRVALLSRMAVALLLVGFLLHAAGVLARGLAAERVPWGNMYEFTISSSLAAAAVYFALWRRYRLQWLGLAVSALLTAALGLAIPLYTPAGPLVPALDSYWLAIHVAAVALAGGGFTIGGLVSLLYLLRDRAERVSTAGGKPLPGWLRRCPALPSMDGLAFRVHAFAFPLWTFGVLIAGPIWALNAWGRPWGWDPKEVWSLIVWLIYAAYLHARVTGGWWGRRAAVVAVVGWAAFLFNFVGVNLLVSGLHSYAGV